MQKATIKIDGDEKDILALLIANFLEMLNVEVSIEPAEIPDESPKDLMYEIRDKNLEVKISYV